MTEEQFKHMHTQAQRNTTTEHYNINQGEDGRSEHDTPHSESSVIKDESEQRRRGAEEALLEIHDRLIKHDSQLEEISASIRLVANLPPPAA